MRLLLHTMATPSLTPIEAFDLAARLGFDGIDLVCQAGYACAIPPDASVAAARELRRAAEARGLVIAALTPYEKRTNAADENERRAGVAALAHAIDLAEALGATSLRILAGMAVEDDAWEAACERLVASLKELAPRAAACGLALNIENHDGTIADSARRTRAIWERCGTPSIGIVYDPANLTRDGMEDFPESLDLQAEAIGLVHVKDYSFTPAVARRAADTASRRAVPVGDGDIAWPAILAALVARGYAGNLSLEYEMRWCADQLPPTEIGAATSLDRLRRIIAGSRLTPMGV